MILVSMFVLIGCGPTEQEGPVDNELFPEKEWTMLSATHEEPIEITFGFQTHQLHLSVQL